MPSRWLGKPGSADLNLAWTTSVASKTKLMKETRTTTTLLDSQHFGARSLHWASSGIVGTCKIQPAPSLLTHSSHSGSFPVPANYRATSNLWFVTTVRGTLTFLCPFPAFGLLMTVMEGLGARLSPLATFHSSLPKADVAQASTPRPTCPRPTKEATGFRTMLFLPLSSILRITGTREMSSQTAKVTLAYNRKRERSLSNLDLL